MWIQSKILCLTKNANGNMCSRYILLNVCLGYMHIHNMTSRNGSTSYSRLFKKPKKKLNNSEKTVRIGIKVQVSKCKSNFKMSTNNRGKPQKRKSSQGSS